MRNQKRNRRLTFVAFFVMVTLIIGAGIYFKKPQSVHASTPAYVLTATELVDAFIENESLANEKYLGKIIQVSGTIIRIDNQTDTLGFITLGNENNLSHLRCAVEKSELKKLKSLSEGDALLIKGYCIGYLMDVEMNKSVIVKSEDL